MITLSTDVITNVVAVCTTVSLAYTYRYDIARKGLWGLSYLKEAFQKKPFCIPILNQVKDKSANHKREDTIRLFSHVDRVMFDYDENTEPLSDAQEESLRIAIINWRAYPLDGISQHISLYDILYNEYINSESETRFPTSITIVYDVLLMDLTDSNMIVSMQDKNDVVLKKHVSNHLVWPCTWNKPMDDTNEACCVQSVEAADNTGAFPTEAVCQQRGITPTPAPKAPTPTHHYPTPSPPTPLQPTPSRPTYIVDRRHDNTHQYDNKSK